MEFRVVGQRIKLLRSRYDRESKRSRQDLVANISLHSREIPESLTNQEKSALTEYFKQLDFEKKSASEKRTIDDAASSIEAIAAAIKNADAIDEKTGLEIQAAVEEIKKALHGHGIKKKMLAPEKTEKPNPRQMPIFGDDLTPVEPS